MIHMRVGRVFLAGAALVGLGGDASALNVAEWAKAYAKPALAGVGADAKGRSFTSGHFELTFASGRLYPVKVGDEAVGAYFVGTGRMRYTSTDPLEAAAYRTNVDRASSYKLAKDGAITDTVESALLWLSSGVQDLAGDAGWSAGETSADAKDRFNKHVERFANDDARLAAQLMPLAILDPPARPAIVAEIVGRVHDLRYTVDPVHDHNESIDVMRRYKDLFGYSDVPFLKDRRYAETLSEQPIDRKRLDACPRRFLLTAVDLSLLNPDGLRAELDVSETFRALVPLRVLDLDLWSRHVGGVGLSGKLKENEYAVQSVTLAGGEALPFSHLRNDLVVQLPRTLAAGEEVTIRFKIAGDVLFRPENLSFWELGTDSWFPQPRLESQRFGYHAVVKVKKPFVTFSCGQTVRRWEEGELSCAEFREEKPIHFPVILAGKYNTYSEEREGITVRVSYYVISDQKAMKKLANLVFRFMEFYKPYLGDYPYKELNLIEIKDLGWGQAPPGVIFITEEAFQPVLEIENRIFSEGINARLAHELAHHWWGDVAQLSIQNQWLAESVAEYFSAYAIGKLWKASKFDGAMSDWKSHSKFVADHSSVYMANALTGKQASQERFGLLYGKGPLVLHALRKELGDNAFFTILKSFLKSFSFQPAETRNFIDLTNYVTKKDYTEWFNKYLLGTEWPKS